MRRSDLNFIKPSGHIGGLCAAGFGRANIYQSRNVIFASWQRLPRRITYPSSWNGITKLT